MNISDYYKSEWQNVCTALRQRNKDVTNLKKEITKLKKENENLKNQIKILEKGNDNNIELLG